MATTINSGDEKKFISLANLKKFKDKTDEKYFNKSGGTITGTVSLSGNGNTANGLRVDNSFTSTGPIFGNTSSGSAVSHITGITAHTKKDSLLPAAWLDNGDRIVVGAKNGLAKLDENGNIPLTVLGNIDTTFVEAVETLPTTNIGKHLYIIKNRKQPKDNIYNEYIYTGSLPITVTNKETGATNYDSSNWEKLGNFEASVDLSPYSKLDDTAKYTNVSYPSDGGVNLQIINARGTAIQNSKISIATTSKDGVMSAADKVVLNKLASRYPFGIGSFKVTNPVIEVGTTNTLTATWAYSNADFHPLKSQTIKINSDNAQTVNIGTYSWQKTDVKPAAGTDRVKYTFTLNAATTDGATKTSSYDVYAVHASFVGVTTKTSLTAAEIVALGNKAILNGRGRTVTVNQSNQRMVIAYPSYLGDLTSVKDGNGFQGINGYVKSTVTSVNGTTYNVYIQSTPATASGTYTIG